MISRKTIGILGVAAVALAGLSVVTSRRYSPAEDGGFRPLLAEPIDPASVQALRAWVGALPDSTVELERSGEGWVVASRWGWTAKKDLVDRALDDLAGLKGELRSSNPDVLGDYSIDDEAGLHLVGSGAGGTELFHLVVGKNAPRGGCFVRRDDGTDVFLTSAGLRSSFGLWGGDDEEPKAPDAKRWIELRVHQADRQAIERIVLRDGSSEIVLEKEFAAAAPPDTAAADTTAAGAAPVDRSQWTWKPDAAGAFDKGKADGILSTLSNLYASDAVEPGDPAALGLAEPSRVATVTLEDGTTTSILFGKAIEDEKKTYVTVGEDGLPAKIYTSTVDRIFPGRDELKPRET